MSRDTEVRVPGREATGQERERDGEHAWERDGEHAAQADVSPKQGIDAQGEF
jgi:hypothetical protein